MPLRAKITNTAFRSAEATEPLVIKEQPGDAPDDVLFNSTYGLRTITLNRPKKLNSLDGSMIRKIVPRLQEWTKSDLANIVVIKGEGRAFCAGGDVAALAKQNNTEEGQVASTDYFAQEYALDHYIATYEKPYIALIDGITMGGGVGLSAHAPFRIATERTVFAMPETTIGLFPDVGASFFLPRLDGQLGMYLALTSEQLKGVNVFFAGVATHYLHSSSLPDLEARLSEMHFRDSDTQATRLGVINSAIEEFTTGLPPDQPISAPVSGDIRKSIDFVFQRAHEYPDMLEALEAVAKAEGAQQYVRDWAQNTIATIKKRSPLSVQVTIQLLRRGMNWNIAETFDNELKLASNFMRHPDFVEGVTALLINKPKTDPKWAESTMDTDQVNAMFDADIKFKSLRQKDPAPYRQYPHARFTLPSEDQIRQYVQGDRPADQEAVIQHFIADRDGKLGVREKVQEVLARKTRFDEGHKHLMWT